ncbi:peptide ABC transporter substrate-binding protein, partial [Psittacicella gerlachiana]
MQNKYFFSLFSLSLFSLVASSFNAQAITIPQGVTLAPKQEYIFNLPSFPATIDPGLIGDTLSARAAEPLFDTLYRLGSSGDFLPTAASGYKVSDDQLTWTFYLRPEATWHDGKPVTAQDFIYAWQRLAAHDSRSIFANAFVNMHVVNADGVYQRLIKVEELGISALDSHTLEIKLYQPTPWLLQIIANLALAPVRQDLIEKYGSAWTQPEHFIGNGPYTLSTYLPNDQITYQKREDYWDSQNIYITQAKAIFSEPRIAYYRYLTGEILVTEVFKGISKQVFAERPSEVYLTPRNASYYLNLNSQSFADLKVRQALALLTDTQYLSKHIVLGATATSIFAPTSLQDGQYQKQAPYFYNFPSDNNAQAIA